MVPTRLGQLVGPACACSDRRCPSRRSVGQGQLRKRSRVVVEHAEQGSALAVSGERPSRLPVEPASSMFSRISPLRCGGFCTSRTRSSSRSGRGHRSRRMPGGEGSRPAVAAGRGTRGGPARGRATGAGSPSPRQRRSPRPASSGGGVGLPRGVQGRGQGSATLLGRISGVTLTAADCRGGQVTAVLDTAIAPRGQRPERYCSTKSSS